MSHTDADHEEVVGPHTHEHEHPHTHADGTTHTHHHDHLHTHHADNHHVHPHEAGGMDSGKVSGPGEAVREMSPGLDQSGVYGAQMGTIGPAARARLKNQQLRDHEAHR
jgi:hypothetical protein